MGMSAHTMARMHGTDVSDTAVADSATITT